MKTKLKELALSLAGGIWSLSDALLDRAGFVDLGTTDSGGYPCFTVRHPKIGVLSEWTSRAAMWIWDRAYTGSESEAAFTAEFPPHLFPVLHDQPPLGTYKIIII